MDQSDQTQLDKFLKECGEQGSSDIASQAAESDRPKCEQDQAFIYEQLLPKKESAFMKRIRRWERAMGFRTPLIWKNIISISLIHIVAVVWFARNLWRLQFPMWQTMIFSFVFYIASGVGVTGGVHRHWSHRSHKQKKPLQALMLMCYSAAGMNSAIEWIRNHRVHHKFSDTIADPHDSNRGFFFSHVGWLFMKKHPEVIRCARQIDLSDITGDPLLQFHRKYFSIFMLIFCFILPMWIPVHFWGESWHNSTLANLVRYIFILNVTFSVNSFAHIWGNKPYDRNINPSDNRVVSFFTSGEGWHNYHHTFPWDYKAAELGGSFLNITTFIIDSFHRIGWTYDLKTASPELIKSVAANRGDHHVH